MPQSTFEQLSRHAANLAREGQGTQTSFESLVDAIRAFPSQAALHSAIERVQAKDRLAGQFAIRACRAVYSVAALTDGVSLMLLAMPCVVSHWPTKGISALQDHIQCWVHLNLIGPEAEDVKVVAARTPTSLQAVQGTLGPTQVLWARSLLRSGEPFGEVAPVNDGPAVWLIGVRLPSPLVDAVQEKVAKTRPASLESSTYRHRIEALAEEAGGFLDIAPVTSWANAPAIARIAAFWRRAKNEKQTLSQGQVVLSLAGACLQANGGSTAGSWGEFPEETFEDLEKMVKNVGQATGLAMTFHAQG